MHFVICKLYFVEFALTANRRTAAKSAVESWFFSRAGKQALRRGELLFVIANCILQLYFVILYSVSLFFVICNFLVEFVLTASRRAPRAAVAGTPELGEVRGVTSTIF